MVYTGTKMHDPKPFLCFAGCRYLRMAQSCPCSNVSDLSTEVSSINQESENSKQNCASPSPTETLVLDSLSTDNAAGK